MALQAPVQGRTRQVWNSRLKGIEAIIEGQQCMPAKGDDDGLFLKEKNCRVWFLRACRQVDQRCPLLPLSESLLIDPIALRKRSQALFTILYCSTDCLCRRGAPV
jgi:hypothetical protein